MQAVDPSTCSHLHHWRGVIQQGKTGLNRSTAYTCTHACLNKAAAFFVVTDAIHKPRHAIPCRHDVVLREVKDLEKGIAHLHNCMAKYNALIADNAGLKAQLVNDNFHLETKISHELKVMLQLCVRVTAKPAGL